MLSLLETFSQQELHAADKDALRLGAISFDAVKHLLWARSCAWTRSCASSTAEKWPGTTR